LGQPQRIDRLILSYFVYCAAFSDAERKFHKIVKRFYDSVRAYGVVGYKMVWCRPRAWLFLFGEDVFDACYS
jgi:hypothetical protein